MADGGRIGVGKVERAARMLAAGSGTGSYVAARVDVGQQVVESRGESVGIAWRGTREESAARSIGRGTRSPALHTWTRDRGTVALPSFRPDVDAVAALAGVEAVPAAWLAVYALEEWHRWPMVERAALVVITGKGAREAVCDAAGRILWRRAAVSQDDRARLLAMRASAYRQRTGNAERLLWRWLDRAADQFHEQLRILKEIKRSHRLQSPRMGTRSPCGLRAETWWHPERYADGNTPAKRHRECSHHDPDP